LTDAVLLALEYLGVFVFAMTGALVGVRLGFDVVGLLCWRSSPGWPAASCATCSSG
jgi:uncharacterized membrane protein YeiH